MEGIEIVFLLVSIAITIWFLIKFADLCSDVRSIFDELKEIKNKINSEK